MCDRGHLCVSREPCILRPSVSRGMPVSIGLGYHLDPSWDRRGAAQGLALPAEKNRETVGQ